MIYEFKPNFQILKQLKPKFVGVVSMSDEKIEEAVGILHALHNLPRAPVAKMMQVLRGFHETILDITGISMKIRATEGTTGFSLSLCQQSKNNEIELGIARIQDLYHYWIVWISGEDRKLYNEQDVKEYMFDLIKDPFFTETCLKVKTLIRLVEEGENHERIA